MWKKYPSIGRFMRKSKRHLYSVAGSTTYWEHKRDGSNISILFNEGFMLIYTRNQLAQPNIQAEIKRLVNEDELKRVLGNKYQLNGELIRKGKSPAQFEVNKEASFIAFDILNRENDTFVKPMEKRNMFVSMMLNHAPFELVYVPPTVEEFEKQIDFMIDVAKDKVFDYTNGKGIEGFVVKWFKDDEMFMIKVKVEHKYSHVREAKIRTKDERLNLELSEVTGAIDKVYMEIGEDIHNKRMAMPKIARAIKEEEIKHKKKCCENIFYEYTKFINNLK